ncbi:MAG TPA: class I SAM-dependent methyltransferase [Thermoplasmata archaeon]|nr:class I SAM-dependent methyltransferase [Thermoplasmata archaeon]
MTEPAGPLHPSVRGFDRAAPAYERGRPDYPASAVAWLARVLGLHRGATVVDLACGTGKLTRALRPTGAAIVAVEPIPGMRAEFVRAVPGIPVVPGTAESIPLPDDFADAVLVAQAFHWFRPGPAVREIARVLRPRGGVGIVWNTRDDRAPVSHGISQIVDRYRRGTPPGPGIVRRTPDRRSERWRSAFDRPDGPFLPLRHRTFDHVQRLDAKTLVDRVLSVSYIAIQSAPERRRIACEVRALLPAGRSGRPVGALRLPYRTDVYWTRRR